MTLDDKFLIAEIAVVVALLVVGLVLLLNGKDSAGMVVLTFTLLLILRKDHSQ